MPTSQPNPLGAFLKDRRARLDPARFGIDAVRRRTPGLRREEVAQRAAVSATWYTWLEQGRGGSPSSEVLERLTEALALSEAEREHLFLLAQSRPPQMRREPPAAVSPRLRAVLEGLELCPAPVVTPTWDVAAWNPAAAAVLTDYGALPPEQRNVLRIFFSRAPAQGGDVEWLAAARHVVAAFRLSTSRSGVAHQADPIVVELSASCPRFAAIWGENEVDAHGEGVKRVLHPDGPLELGFSTFAVDAAIGLTLLVYTPIGESDRARVAAAVKAHLASR